VARLIARVVSGLIRCLLRVVRLRQSSDRFYVLGSKHYIRITVQEVRVTTVQ